MTDVRLEADELLSALRQASGDTGLRLAERPRPLNPEGTAHVLRLAPSDSRSSTPAVIRLCDRSTNAAREAIIEDHLHRNGYPTPAVLLTGSPDDALGGAWLLIELVPEIDALSSLSRRREMIRLVRELWTRPVMLADLTARLHKIDPEPVGRELARTGSCFDWRQFLWDRATSVEGPEAAEVVDWMERKEPRSSRLVLSHGDLHLDNIVIGADGPRVVDWGIGCLAPPARDVACTMFALLTTGFRRAPGPTGPAFAALGRGMSRRFLRQYRARTHAVLPADELDWHRVLYSMNRLFWAAHHADLATAEDSADPRATAVRTSRMLDREFPIHARIINGITGIDLLGDSH